ncbi:MAG: chorismate synthase [Actinomycetota bacterium]|nr:chorismate synthase [Actinomycetota bacterium]
MEFLTAGESHGKVLCGIINDYPSGVLIKKEDIDIELLRRQKGYGRGKRMQIEKDEVEILSGIRNNLTLGSPISFIVRNKDWDNWKKVMAPFKQDNEIDHQIKEVQNPRPGHADLIGSIKYRFKDIRNVIERSSARETAVRVVTGSFSKQFLKYLNIKIYSFVTGIGEIVIKDDIILNNQDDDFFKKADLSDIRCPDEKTASDMKNEIDKAFKNKDTLGGSFLICIRNMPCGIGSYTQWNKRLDALLSYYLMSIPSVKALEIGNGIKASTSLGTKFHDEIFYNETKKYYRSSNNAGGIEGGMSNGEDIILKVFLKPIPTTMKGLKTINIKDKSQKISIKERSDICAVPAASIIGEAMAAIALVNLVQDKFGRDNIQEIIENHKNYLKYIKDI